MSDAGDRFAFGANWRRFLEVVDDEHIVGAERSLTAMLGGQALRGRTFLDVGCGSGLLSLAALRLGAGVRGFDFDPDSVAAACELKRRYAPDDDQWSIERGSILDADFVRSLGTFDVVYCWGVAHHTGDMWQALAHVSDLVAPGGAAYVAIYNDQGLPSHLWRRVKRRYNTSGFIVRWALTAGAWTLFETRGLAARVVSRRRLRSSAGRERGMAKRTDLVDWVGGWPFEVAKPEEVFAFFLGRAFELAQLRTCGGGIGCNEFVFRRSSAVGP